MTRPDAEVRLVRRNLMLHDAEYELIQKAAKERGTSAALYERFILAAATYDPDVQTILTEKWRNYDYWRKLGVGRNDAADFYSALEAAGPEGDIYGKAQDK